MKKKIIFATLSLFATMATYAEVGDRFFAKTVEGMNVAV